MSRCEVGIELFLMALAAGNISGKTSVLSLRRIHRGGGRILRYGIGRKTRRQSEHAESNRNDQTRCGDQVAGVRGSFPPARLGYGNSYARNKGISMCGRLCG